MGSAAFALLLSGLTGCSDGQGTGGDSGAPSSTAAGFEDTAAPSSAPSAPKVGRPLDATKYLKSPCSVLTSHQLARLDVDGPGNPDTSSGLAAYGGPSCAWSNREEANGIAIGFPVGNARGLADLYRGDAAGLFPYFEPTEITGYPAVLADRSDRRADGFCQVAVGLSDKLTFIARKNNGDGFQSCSDAKQIAAAALRTVKGNG